jgi:hypothetical protein
MIITITSITDSVYLMHLFLACGPACQKDLVVLGLEEMGTLLSCS